MAEKVETPVYVPGIGAATALIAGEKKQVTVFKPSESPGFWSCITLSGVMHEVKESNLSFPSKSAVNLANGTGAAQAMEKLHNDRRELRQAYPNLLDKRDVGRKADSEFMDKIRKKCESGEYKSPAIWTQKLGKDEDEVLYIGKLRHSAIWPELEALISGDGYTFKEYVPEKRETADTEE